MVDVTKPVPTDVAVTVRLYSQDGKPLWEHARPYVVVTLSGGRSWIARPGDDGTLRLDGYDTDARREP